MSSFEYHYQHREVRIERNVPILVPLYPSVPPIPPPPPPPPPPPSTSRVFYVDVARPALLRPIITAPPPKKRVTFIEVREPTPPPREKVVVVRVEQPKPLPLYDEIMSKDG